MTIRAPAGPLPAHKKLVPMTVSTPTASQPALVSSVSQQDAMAVVGLIKRLTAAWTANDADAMSELYAEDGTVVLPGDVYLKGRPAIRDWLAWAFETKWKGTTVLGVPLEMRYLTDDICLLVSQGGAYLPGADHVTEADAIRGIWIFVRQDGDWIVTAYENTPVRAAIPVP